MEWGTLHIHDRNGAQRDLPITKSPLKIGREGDNDVVLNDASVSRYHAQLDCDNQGCHITDLGSANGTFVDGTKLAGQQPQSITADSAIRIGAVRVGVQLTANSTQHAPDDDALLNQLLAVAPTQARADDALLNQLLAVAPTQVPPSVPGQTPRLGNPAFRSTQVVRNQPAAQGVASGRPPQVPATPTAPGGGRTPPPRTPLPLQAKPQQQMYLTIAPTELTVEAGTIMSVMITVVNRSPIVDRIGFGVNGLPAAWITITPDEVSLLPGEQGTAQVTIQPPRDPSSKAGTYAFEVEARSTQRPAESVATRAQLSVQSFNEFQPTLSPQQQTGQIQGTYIIEVANNGNQAMPFRVQGRDDENAMRFRLTPPTLYVEPGQSAQVRVLARMSAWRWLGKPRTYPFNLQVEPANKGAPSRVVAGRLVHQPPFPTWLLPVVLALPVIACLMLTWLFKEPIARAVTPNPAAPTVDAQATAMAIGNTQTAEAQRGAAEQTQTALALANNGTSTALAQRGVAEQTQTALALANNGTSTALAGAFNLTATIISGANSAAQTTFALQVQAAKTEQANIYAQTATTFALNTSMTQTAFATNANNMATAQAQTAASIAIAQANQNATATVEAHIRLTDQANTNGTATAVAQTLTALPAQNALTQTAQSIHATQTALAQPTPTPSPVLPNADQIITFAQLHATPVVDQVSIRGDEYVNQDVLICMYHRVFTFESATITPTPTATPDTTDCQPRAIQSARTSQQDRPVILPPPAGDANAPLHVLTAMEDNQAINDAIGVINFQRNVVDVNVTVWLPKDFSAQYQMVAVDGNGQVITSFVSEVYNVPNLYQLTLRSEARPTIRQVVIMFTERESTGVRSSIEEDSATLSFSRQGDSSRPPLYINSIALRYSP